MATRAKQQYYGDWNNIVKNKRTFELSQDILDKIDEAWGGAIETIKVNGITQPIVDKTVNIPVPLVEDNLNSYSTTNALSANQGRLLQDAINNFQTIGHFLSLWNAETWLPMDNPSISPYQYNTWDYYIVSNTGSRNYRPDGSEYVTGQASMVEETQTVSVDDFYFYNGTNWFLLSNEWPSLAVDTALSTTSTNPVENRVITTALNNKADSSDLDDFYTKTEVDDKIEDAVTDNVKDGVLTIQKNGTTQWTFSANQSTDETINLTINKIDVGLSNVDNTSDADKPISTATQWALDNLSDRIDALEDGDIQDMKDDIADLQENKADKTDIGDATLTVQKNWVDVGTFTANSKTDATINLALTKADVGLNNVDNTADIDKPISTATQAALDDKADKSDLNDYYTKTETDKAIDDAIDAAIADSVSDATITITQGGVTKGTFTLNQSADGTIALDAGSDDWMEYPDFNFVEKTGASIELDLSSKIVEPSADFTINAPQEIKDWQIYILRVDNAATVPTMTLGTNITNPYSVDLSLSPSKTDTFAFLAVDGKLELQPTEAEVPDNVYTKSEVDALLDDKADATDINVIAVTQAEYDALTEAEKTDWKLRLIKDAPVLTIQWWSGGDLSNYYNKQETDTLLAEKADVLNTYTKSEVNNLVEDKGDVKYADFNFVAMTWTEISDLSSTKDISADTTLTVWEVKEWMQYLVRVTNTDTATHTVTAAGQNVEVEAGETKSLVFLATSDSTLELQECSGSGGWTVPGNWTITIEMDWTEAGSFTVNQNENTTIELFSSSVSNRWDIQYEDYNFNTKTWATVPLSLNSTITPTSDFTVTKPSNTDPELISLGEIYSDGQLYVLRVNSWATAYEMTLGANVTNPYNVDLTLEPNSLSQFVFLAVDWNLELQPELITKSELTSIVNTAVDAAVADLDGYVKSDVTWHKVENIWRGTQAEYEALWTYDANTLYITKTVI